MWAPPRGLASKLTIGSSFHAGSRLMKHPRNSTQWSLVVFVKQRFAGDASQ